MFLGILNLNIFYSPIENNYDMQIVYKFIQTRDGKMPQLLKQLRNTFHVKEFTHNHQW